MCSLVNVVVFKKKIFYKHEHFKIKAASNEIQFARKTLQ